MADNIEKFLTNRWSYHAASRIAINVGQSLAQATNADGHIVTDAQIWTSKNEEFPKNNGAWKTNTNGYNTTVDLIKTFKSKYVVTTDETFQENTTYYIISNPTDPDSEWVEASDVVANETIPTSSAYYVLDETAIITQEPFVEGDTNYVSGKVWKNSLYPAVSLLEGVVMSPIDNANFQAWEVLDYSGKFADTTNQIVSGRILDWCTPTAVKDNGLPVPGFTGIIEATNSTPSTESVWTYLPNVADLEKGWALLNGTWQFVYMAGMLIFHPDYVPSKMGQESLRITAFQYVGSRLNSTIEDIKSEVGEGLKQDITELESDITELDKDITGLETDISTLTTKVNGFEAIVSESKEIDEAIIQITSSEVTGIDIPTGLAPDAWSGSVVNGEVTIEFNKEVLGVQQLDNETGGKYEDVYPDESLSFNQTGLVTTLSADFGDLLSGNAIVNWRITYRI